MSWAIVDQFGAISRGHALAIDQIQMSDFHHHIPCKVVDLGVGNGEFLNALKKTIPHAECTGIDVSAEKLKRAKELLPLTTIEASASDAIDYLPRHSQDLVLAHFVNAYISMHTLFNCANSLTRANGYFSLITTTYDSFPATQQRLADFINQGSRWSPVVGHYYKSLLQNTTVAASEKELLAAFARYDFELCAHQRIEVPMTFYNLDEFALFVLESTWFLNSLAVRMIPKHFVLQRVKRLFTELFTFPYHETHLVDVVLARKNASD
jgi:SAM-dependent methyltransferase